MDVAAGQRDNDEAAAEPAPASSSIYDMDLARFESEGGGGHADRGLVTQAYEVHNASLPAGTLASMAPS